MDTMNDSEAMDRSAARNVSDAEEQKGASDICHEKACALPATSTCERCGQRFCTAHCGELALQRRDHPSSRPTHQSMLERLPTHTESYTLCAPCRTKPVPRNFPPLPAPQSAPSGGTLGARDREVANRWAGIWTLDGLDDQE